MLIVECLKSTYEDTVDICELSGIANEGSKRFPRALTENAQRSRGEASACAFEKV